MPRSSRCPTPSLHRRVETQVSGVKLAVYWFGRPARSPYEPVIADLIRRVSRRWPAEDIPLKPAGNGRDREPAAALDREADTLFRRLPDRWVLVALDERGEGLSSEALAHRLEAVETRGAAGIALALGSDLGLSERVRRRADLVVSLSSMTFPHLMARLVLWEQLFRATDILGPGRYHRSGTP